MRRRSANDLTSFRDFNVRRARVARALLQLKKNNKLYNEIIIDDEILKSLLENGFVIDQLPQVQDNQEADENDCGNENSDNNDSISRSFVSLLPNTRREQEAINKTLDRIQCNNPPILWSEIDGTPINEFQTPGYIARAFPTLYPYGKADLRSARPKIIKPAEYFKYLL